MDRVPVQRPESRRATLSEAGTHVPGLLVGDLSAGSGYALGRRLAERPDVAAVFASDDQMAPGVLRALQEAGRRVPQGRQRRRLRPHP